MSIILTVNAGSSSVRFAIFSSGARPARLLDGKLERIGQEAATVAGDRLAQRLKAQTSMPPPAAIGHPGGHGMQPTRPERASGSLLGAPRGFAALCPEHLPRRTELI